MVNHLYLLEVSWDVYRDSDCRTNGDFNADTDTLNPGATEFRPKKNSATLARLNISDEIQKEYEPPLVE